MQVTPLTMIPMQISLAEHRYHQQVNILVPASEQSSHQFPFQVWLLFYKNTDKIIFTYNFMEAVGPQDPNTLILTNISGDGCLTTTMGIGMGSASITGCQ
jgi:hypothetical protein